MLLSTVEASRVELREAAMRRLFQAPQRLSEVETARFGWPELEVCLFLNYCVSMCFGFFFVRELGFIER